MAHDTRLLEGIHTLLSQAMFESAQADWPASPHLGGPKPRIDDQAQLACAFLCADHVRDALDEGAERSLFETLIDVARRNDRARWIEMYAQVQSGEREASKHVGRNLLDAVDATLQQQKPVAARNSIALVQRYAVQALGGGEKKASPTVKALLVAIDQHLLCADLTSLLAEREVTPSAPLVSLVYRPKTKSARPEIALARLADGRLALWVKLKSKRDWIEGTDAEVLASVPEAHFAAASAAVAAAATP